MNKVILVGNLTRDPEGSETASGVQIARFTVAVSRRFKNSEGGYDTDFINCVAWRNQADFVTKYARKGIKVGVVRPITLSPFPSKRLNELADKCKKFVVVEMNMGQMVNDVKLAVNGKASVYLINRPVGQWLSVEEITEGVKEKVLEKSHAGI